ncbi:hypothetical protein BKA56DRAFT_484473 [Ilyonectria sp. MPI-CAGE-AT-0026]|nr:hypothetical protein BKA56DRAFT_484473 [Ilyonectria sp. MPI-CAGE-AT-0026]
MTPPRAFDFASDVAIVTDAGSRMNGDRAAAVLLAHQGAKVALVDFNIDWTKDIKRMIDEEGGTPEVFQADVTDDEPCKNAVAMMVELDGAVHILVNIVGVGGAMGDTTTIDMDAWDSDLYISGTSMVLMSRYAILEMRKQGRGSIVNMSSVSGRMLPLIPPIPLLLYLTTKGAIIQITRAIAAHHGRENIHVNCVTLGMVYTHMTRGRGMTKEIRQARIY